MFFLKKLHNISILGYPKNGDKMKEDLELIKHIYQDSEMATFTLNELQNLIKDKDNKIKGAIEDILTTYTNFQEKSKEILQEEKELESIKMTSKVMAKMGIKKEVKGDNSDASIAKMLIEGITMGSLDMTKKIHDYQEKVEKKTMTLAKSFLKFQEESIEKLKKFL